jgi:cellobiose phosphorylase
MRFGYFDDDNREYVITRPDTPLPWINYLGMRDYFSLISNTAGGYAFYQDARFRRITRYRYNNVPLDMGGRYLYLRDDESGQFWSPTWMPTRHQAEDYTCRHGMGYTCIGSTYQGIRADVRYFVPLDHPLEIWDLMVQNHSDNARSLSLFSSVEFCLWEALDDATNFQRNLNIGEVEVLGSVIYHKTEYRERRDHFAYFACSEPLAGFETQREAFLGPYRGWENPQAVEQGQTSQSLGVGWSPVGVHQVRLTLEPGAQKRVIFLLGYHENPVNEKFEPGQPQTINKSTVLPMIKSYLDPATVDGAFDSLRAAWEDLLGVLQVKSPDAHVDRMVNIWNAYQCMITFNLSRSASYFESGIGRGMGFRDSNQDLLGFVHMVPERARQRILDLAATQLENGGAYHQYQPLTKRGNDAVGSNFNDDPAWLVLSTAGYLKETGDLGILEEAVPYENKPGTETPLLEHLQRCIQYTLDRLGPHGLPLIGRADWNDCLNLNTFSERPGESFQTTSNRDGQVAESVVIAALFIMAANELALISAHLGLSDENARLTGLAEKMVHTIRQHGWDGEWFLRAYDHFGDVVGSQACREGQIFIEPQGLCILAGVGVEDGMAERALQSVAAHLATEHGVLLLQPAYTQYHLHLGEISTYPPGYKENASIFCHTNPWVMIAEAILGHGDRALDYYLRINPSQREGISDLHRCEPYVYAQTIAGADNLSFGEAKNSWLTGTAAWNFVAITQWILGIRPDYEGLRVEPVLPASWAGFTATRKYRGVIYKIRVHRRGPGSNVFIKVDGVPVESSLITTPDKERVEVDVVVG